MYILINFFRLSIFQNKLLQFYVWSSYNSYQFKHRCFHLAFLRRTTKEIFVKTSLTITSPFITFKRSWRPSSYSNRSTHISTSKQFINLQALLSYNYSKVFDYTNSRFLHPSRSFPTTS